MDQIKEFRDFMKANFQDWGRFQTDQDKNLPHLPIEKPEEGGQLINLPHVMESDIPKMNLFFAIKNRKSRRKYTKEEVSLVELSFLLMATQGIKKVDKNGVFSVRTVPSGGARHPFVTYLAIQKVKDIEPGIYRYHPVRHQLEFLFFNENSADLISEGTYDQPFAGNCAVTFIWSVIPYRSEWRYHISAHKTMLLDAGHVCQNLYLACEAISAGTCAIAAYDQKFMDDFLKLDGQDEFVVYLAPVGKI